MGQKVNPHGLRVGVIKNWDSRWFAKDAQFGDLLVEDYNIRKVLKKKLYDAGVAAIEIAHHQGRQDHPSGCPSGPCHRQGRRADREAAG